ncbi:hypothetical protein SAMD00023353_0104890 [Rosellinia necatrix]|uniref:Infection structure specific protein n=1 Tax=Rosellinia necatrix TaxID=77044 RepID=A0A1S7UIC1_ROSNE|nr:hypothetical protein SAMD00023353_0104890 [Rosellinia necatrix]
MHSTKVLLSAAALAGMSLAQKSDAQFCSDGLSSFFSQILVEAPTTPAAILSFIASQTEIPAVPTSLPPGFMLDPEEHQSQLCALATALPSSLLPEFQTLASGLLEFGREHSSEFIAFITNCADPAGVASTTSYLEYIFTATGNICQETGAAATTSAPAPGGASNGTYPTATPAPTLTSTTSLIPTAAAARPTGAIMGAIAAGGVLGAAAML